MAKNDVAVLEPLFNKLQENTTQRFILGRGMWVHGATTPWEYFKMFQAYSLANAAKNIQCPTFVAEAENDRRRGGAKDLYNALQCPKNMCSLRQVKALASTARRARARYFCKKCLVGSIPSWPDERVAIDAARNVIETHAHKGRVAHFDDCKEIVSTCAVRCELSTAASGALLACSSWAGTDGSSLPQLKYGGKNHEKNALDHRPGGSDVIFVGDIPKTRNAKVMRRIVRAAYLGEQLGDTSALENPASLNEIKLAAK